MSPLRCPVCDLQWNVRDDAPRVVSCPRCLAALNNPYVSAPPPIPAAHSNAPSPPAASSARSSVRPPPLRVLPVDHQIQRDTAFGKIGIIVVLVIVGIGVLSLFAAGAGGANSGTILLVAIGVVISASVAMVLLSLKMKRSGAPSPATSSGYSPGAIGRDGLAPLNTSNAVGQVIDYGRPMRDPNKLSGAAFFGQTIGGIVLGIVGTLMACGFFSSFSNGNAIAIGLFTMPAIGVALCFMPKLRGLGVGLIIALPAGFLILLGFCAIIMTGSNGFNFH